MNARALVPYAYALVLLLALAEVFFLAPGVLRYHVLEALVLTLTLQVGHVAFSYVMILRDPELRARFPWLSFAALNGAIYAGLWAMGKKFHIENQAVLLVVYNAIRIYHDTQQGYGVANILSADHVPPRPEAARGRKRFIVFVQVMAIGGMVLSSQLAHWPSRVAVALLVVASTACAFCFLVLRDRAEGDPAHLVLGRFHLLGLGYVSHISPLFLRTIHGLEYAYVFFRFFRSRAVAYVVAGLALAVLVQGGFVLAKVFVAGINQAPAMRVFAVLIQTMVITHIVQDWYVFAYDRASALRMRKLLGA